MLTHNILDALVLKYEGHCTLDQSQLSELRMCKLLPMFSTFDLWSDSCTDQYRMVGNFEGEHFHKFQGFVAIHESFRCEIWRPCIFWQQKWAISKSFSPWKVIFHQFISIESFRYTIRTTMLNASSPCSDSKRSLVQVRSAELDIQGFIQSHFDNRPL